MAIIRFAFIVDNEVSHMLEIDDSANSPVVPKIINMYRTKPISFVEITDEQKNILNKGWTWDGQNFYPPAE